LQIALIARGTRSECEYPLGSGRPKSWLGPTSSDLAPYQCGDLIKHQYTSAKLLGPQMVLNKKLINYKVVALIDIYNLDFGRFFIQGRLKFLIFKILELQIQI
jgi:hypothetical protein